MSTTWQWVRRACAAALVMAAACGSAPARADEAGSGHYLPGFFSYFAGILPSERGIYFANITSQYVGAAGGNRPLEIGGKVRFGVQAYMFVEAPSFTYVTGRKVLGGSLGMNLTIPVVYLDATAAVAAGPVLKTVNDTNFNLSDIYFAPVMLGWDKGNLHWMLVGGVFAPTGEWHFGQLAPAGKNFWTFEPGLGFTYLNPKSGWEVSTYTAIDFNSRNQTIDYKSGDDFHVDFVVANHVIRGIITPEIQKALEDAKKLAEAVASGQLPPGPPPGASAKGEGKGAAPKAPKIVLQDVAPGIGGYWYQQVTGDSGRAAVLGPFKGRALALGPELLGTASFGKTPVTFQLKVLEEFSTQNRLQGINTWFDTSLKF